MAEWMVDGLLGSVFYLKVLVLTRSHNAALNAGGLVYDLPRSIYRIENANRKNYGKEVLKQSDDATRS